MNKQKTFWFSLLVLASVLAVTSFASATQIVNLNSVQVNGIETLQNASAQAYNVSVIAGQSMPVTIAFTANANESNVRMSVELQGLTTDVQNQVFVGDIEQNQTYSESTSLNIPSNIGDQPSNTINMVITVWNGDSSVEQTIQTITLNEQRPSYNAQVMSLNTLNSVNAGQLLPVNVVLQNVGYNELNNMYVIANIPSLGVSKSAYFGDIMNPTSSSSNDTVSGTIYLQVPYSAAPGTYTIQVEAKNNNFDTLAYTSVNVKNDFQSNVVASSPSQTGNAGQDVTYNLMVVNPTNNIKLYSLVYPSVAGLTVTGDSVVTVPAGSSQAVSVTANAASAGNYNFTVNTVSDGQVTGTANLALLAQGGVSSPIVILTIVLAVIFVVLLVVLIVLVTKKPSASSKKQEEFSESYY